MFGPLGKLNRHVLPALAAAVASLALPLTTGADVSGTQTTAAARGADTEDAPQRPGAELFPVGSPAFQTAQRVAGEHWGAAACNGQVTFTWAALEQGTNATAAWRNPTHAWDNTGENFDCVITLNTNADYDLPSLCTVLAHEMGHLLGRQHAEQDGDLMSPLYSEALPACAATAPADDAEAIDVDLESTSAVGRAASRRAARARCLRALRAGRRVKPCAKPARRATARAARVARTRH